MQKYRTLGKIGDKTKGEESREREERMRTCRVIGTPIHGQR